MKLYKWIGACALIYSIGLFLVAQLVSSRLTTNDIGALMLRYKDAYATLPISLATCAKGEAEIICRLPTKTAKLVLHYKLEEPFQIHGDMVDSKLCRLEYGGNTLECKTYWINHPSRRVAYIELADHGGAQIVGNVQSEWPLENISESTWMNLAMLNAIPISIALWILTRKLILKPVQQFIRIGLIGFVTWTVTLILALVMLQHLID